tara:strand:+ start:246 stop:464 length:219 start_codon:yes stop_codon:yes gene_type:complete
MKFIKCTKCKIPKKAEEFYEDKRKRNNCNSWCKKCSAIETRKNHYKMWANPETREKAADKTMKNLELKDSEY